MAMMLCAYDDGSGWKNLTLNTGVSGQAQIAKDGHAVFLRGSITVTANTDTTICSGTNALDAEYRPAYNLRFPISTSVTGNTGWLTIATDGTVKVRSTNVEAYGVFSYYV